MKSDREMSITGGGGVWKGGAGRGGALVVSRFRRAIASLVFFVRVPRAMNGGWGMKEGWERLAENNESPTMHPRNIVVSRGSAGLEEGKLPPGEEEKFSTACYRLVLSKVDGWWVGGCFFFFSSFIGGRSFFFSFFFSKFESSLFRIVFKLRQNVLELFWEKYTCVYGRFSSSFQKVWLMEFSKEKKKEREKNRK